MLEWVYYIVAIAFTLQALSYLFVYARTGNRFALRLGLPASLLMAAGSAMVQISIGDDPWVSRADLLIALRICYLLGSLLWIAEQIIYVWRFLRIIPRKKKPGHR